MRYRLLSTTILIVSTVALAQAASPASAEPTDGARFKADAVAEGLTSAEADALQMRVNRMLIQSGGRQVAANKIVYNHGGYLLLSLPGEEYARELDKPVGAPAAGCSHLWFCAYSLDNYRGDRLAQKNCSPNLQIPWFSWGSFENDQTWGTGDVQEAV